MIQNTDCRPPLRVGLLSPATYNATTGRMNQGPTRLMAPLTWPIVTAVLNDEPGRDRYRYVGYDDVTQDDLSILRDLPVILVSAYTGHIFRALELAQALRRQATVPQKLILGGIHVTSVVKETVRARLFRRLREAGATAPDLDPSDRSRITPLFKLVEIARPHLAPGELDDLLRDPARHLEGLLAATAEEELLETGILPGPWYFAELQRLHESFDVLVAGLLDGRPTGPLGVRDQLLAEIDSPEIRSRTILTLGFGEVNDQPTPNWELFFQDDAVERLLALPVSSDVSKRPIPILPLESGRGCQHACDFCSVVNFFGPLRYRDTTLVVRDIEHGIGKLGALEYFFVDDNLNGNIRHFRELMSALRPIKEKQPRFGWGCQLSFANIARFEEDVVAARKAGMNSCFLGLESLSDAAYAGVNKAHNSRENIRRGLAILKRLGVVAYCNIITGLPTDGPDFPEYTLRGLRELDVSAIVPFNCALLPGTSLLNQLYRRGDADLKEVVESGWKYNNSFDIVRGTDHLSKAELAGVRRRFVEAYGSYEHMLATAVSYYESPPLHLNLAEWVQEVGPFLQIVAFNQVISEALAEDRHYMACGPYVFDVRRFTRLCRDAARRRERGVGGHLRSLILDALYLASPLITRYLSRSGESTRIRVTCSSRKAVDAWARNGAQGKAPAADAAEAFAPGE